MRRSLKAFLVAAAIATALAAVPAAGASGGTATLNVVHGIPGAQVDVCAKGPATNGVWGKILSFPQFQYGVAAPVAGLAPGAYDAKVVAAGADCAIAQPVSPELALNGAALGAGQNVSVVAALAPGGGVGLVVGANDTSKAGFGKGRLTAYHAAPVGAVDVRGGLVLWLPTLFGNVTYGQSAARVVPGLAYTVAVTNAGKGPFSIVAGPTRLAVPAGQNTVVYVVGAGKDTRVVVQRIPLA